MTSTYKISVAIGSLPQFRIWRRKGFRAFSFRQGHGAEILLLASRFSTHHPNDLFPVLIRYPGFRGGQGGEVQPVVQCESIREWLGVPRQPTFYGSTSDLTDPDHPEVIDWEKRLKEWRDKYQDRLDLESRIERFIKWYSKARNY